MKYAQLESSSFNKMRRPGIEPGSQEWESCMIPLHQRRPVFEEENNIRFSHNSGLTSVISSLLVDTVA